MSSKSEAFFCARKSSLVLASFLLLVIVITQDSRLWKGPLACFYYELPRYIGLKIISFCITLASMPQLLMQQKGS